MASTALPDALALQRLYHWEKAAPDKTVFTQPLGGGVVKDYTWKQALDEVRRTAAYLNSLPLEPGTKIAMLAKNTAHWMMADWVIWMAGHVSVPLCPTLAAGTVRQILEHSESRLLFVGKLDGWDDMKAGVPAGLPMVTLPLAPKVAGAKTRDQIIAKTAPLSGTRCAAPTSCCKQREATQAAFTEDGWLKTGDKGSIDAEGNSTITGRVKNLFKTGKGKYVAPPRSRTSSPRMRPSRPAAPPAPTSVSRWGC